MKAVGSISILHIVLLAMTFIGLKNHVTIIPSLLYGAGRDAWISVILATIFTIPWLWLLLFIQKKLNNESLRTNLLTNYPKLGYVVLYGIVIYLLLMAAFTMRETLQWVSTTFLFETPILLLFFFLTVVCFLLATSSILTITIVNVIVLFGVLVLGFFVAFVNIKVKDYFLLMPFLEHGIIPVAKTMVYPASGFVELAMLLFIHQHIAKPLTWKHYVLMLLLIFGLTLGPLLGAITEFGPTEATKQRYPAFEEWRIASIGNFIDHLDFFSIYQWLTGAFVRIAFTLFITIELLDFTRQRANVWRYVFPAFVFITLPLFLIDDSIFYKWKGQYFLISTTVFFISLSVLLAFIVKANQKRKEADHEPD